ncbi:MAG: SOS response-associated peptidase, partial [Planctomycetota bacterium]
SQPMWIRIDGGRPFAFAGLYEIWHPRLADQMTTCTIVTTEPNQFMREIHDRMPVILSEDDCKRWIDPNFKDKTQLSGMLKPFDARRMEAQPVSTYVNSPLHEGRQCIEKVATA